MRQAALRAVAEARVFALEAHRGDLLPEVDGLYAAYLDAPREMSALKNVLDAALSFSQRLGPPLATA